MRIAFACQNGLDDGLSGCSADIGQHIGQLQIHLRQRLLHPLDVPAGTLYQIIPLPLSMPPASGCITSRLMSSFCIFRIISRRCLRFISCQWCCVGWLVALLFCSSGLDFMLTFLCRIQLGSARLAKTTQSRQRGRAVLLFRTTPAAIYTIARTGAMLLIGQERSRENAALAAEPSCALDFSWATP